MGRFAGKDILDRSKAFSVAIIRLLRKEPDRFVTRRVADQLLRSATSIGANLHEADMAETVPDFCNKVNIAQKEAAESTYWLSLLHEVELFPADQLTDLQAEADELRKILREIVRVSRKPKQK